jgi:hypothetical protein
MIRIFLNFQNQSCQSLAQTWVGTNDKRVNQSYFKDPIQHGGQPED